MLAAALEVERPVFFSVLMIIGAYLPLLSLTSIEGLLFRPMALTLVFALLGALFFALFVVPVLATILFRHGYQEWENPLLRWFRPVYAAGLRGMLHMRWLVVVAVAGLLAIVFVRVLPRLGTEFLPYMDEGVIWIRANFPEGTSIEQTTRFGKNIRQIILDFPEIQFATVQAGRNDSGTDPFPPSRMELMVGPKPRGSWKRFHTKHDLVAALGKQLRKEFPTTRFNFTQPIIDSVTEDTNGTSANLAVEFSGPDSDVLLGLARKTVDLLRKVPGTLDVSIEQEGPQPQLQITPDPALCARYNVRIDDVNRLINTALGGAAGRRPVRGRSAFRHRGQARPQRRHFGPGDRPLAGLHPRRHSRAAGASGPDQDHRRPDDHRPRERRPPHDRALRHQRPRPGRLRGRGPAAVCRADRQDRCHRSPLE